MVLGAPWYWLHARSSTPGAGAYISWLMWSPAVAALLTIRLTRQSVSVIGWRWPGWRWVALSSGIPLIYLTVTYAIGWLAGGGGFPNQQFIEKTRASFAWTGFPAWLVILGYIVVNGSRGIVSQMALTLGEEIGWRGYLTPLVARRFNLAATSLIVGSIWGVWHFPLIFLSNPFGRANIIAALCMLGGLIGVTFALVWLRMRSGSVWTAAVFHAAHNTFNGTAMALTVSNAKTDILLDETGVVIVLTGATVALVFWIIDSRQPDWHAQVG